MTYKDTNDRIVCIIQGRMGSSRLPGKVLKDINGSPMLAWMVERASQCVYVDEVWVATTTDDSDDPIAEFCHDQKVNCFRGSVYDVLDRFYQTALRARADVIVRLTADCPLIDPSLMGEVIAALYENKADFAANRLPPPFHRTYPIGLDVEVVKFQGLERAWREAVSKFEREHVMPYFYDDPDRFSVSLLHYGKDYGHYRWTVDTPEDLALVRNLAEALQDRKNFSWLDVLEVYEANETFQQINAEIGHKTYLDIDNRMIKQGEAE